MDILIEQIERWQKIERVLRKTLVTLEDINNWIAGQGYGEWWPDLPDDEEAVLLEMLRPVVIGDK